MKKKNLTCSDLCSADSGRSPCIFPILSYRSFFFKGYERHFQQFLRSSKAYCFDNFAYVLQRPDYFIALKNSAIITGVAIVAMVFFFPCVLMPFPAEDLHPVFTAFSTFSW